MLRTNCHVRRPNENHELRTCSLKNGKLTEILDHGLQTQYMMVMMMVMMMMMMMMMIRHRAEVAAMNETPLRYRCSNPLGPQPMLALEMSVLRNCNDAEILDMHAKHKTVNNNMRLHFLNKLAIGRLRHISGTCTGK